MTSATSLVRVETPGGVRIGVATADGVHALPVDSMAELLALPLPRILALVENPGDELTVTRLLPPLDGRGEVWCAGVTYARSMGARMEESTEASVYDKVYAAERPELFGKAPAWRVVTDGEPVGIRADSGHDVPEPELVLYANAAGELVGLGIGNDMSSRSIEGENPVYIPQAKVYAGAMALAPRITLLTGVGEPTNLAIGMRIERAGNVVFSGETSTTQLARRPADLLEWLFRGCEFPDGVALSTGTGIVPELDFALQEGDVITIEIAGLGSLSNTVAVGREPFSALCRGERPTAG